MWVRSASYTFACGFLTSASFYFGERWCRDSHERVRMLVVLGFCIVSGFAGEFVGSALVSLFRMQGHWGPVAAGIPFSRRIALSWTYAPIMAAVTAFFGMSIYGFELVRARLESASDKLKERELQAERLLKLTAEAELKALQARINPHFLFNTLNSIASLISEDPAKAEEMTERLSTLFRYTLNVNRGERVRLEQELHILQSYVEIEKLRLGSRLRVAVDVDECLQGLEVPPLILQPIVENSVKYAVAPREEGGDITVRGRRMGNRCVLEVIDDGPGFPVDGKPSGHGLENIRQRLELCYGGDHSFSISRAGGSTMVVVDIPCCGEDRG